MDTTTTTETTTITIRRVEGQTDLHVHYRGQTSSQPVYVTLDCETGELSADASGEIGPGVPMRVYHRRALRWRIPALKADAANALLEEIAEEACTIVAGYTRRWDGNNHVGSYTDAATDAIDAVSSLCERAEANATEHTTVQVWDALDYLTANGCSVTRRATADGYGITGATTDDELAALVERVETDAGAEGVDELRDTLGALKTIRDLAAEESDDA